MGQTLTNGIFLPNEGERNCYTGLAGNWRAIDGYIGGYNVHIADAVIHVSQADRDKLDAVDNKADASALTAHTGNTTIHVTAEDKSKWDAVTNKANDADVLHKSGDETKTGKLTVTELNTTKINNLNPSALSLPDLSNGIDISGYITVKADANIQSTYTPPSNGWVCVKLSKSGGSFAVLLQQEKICGYGRNITLIDHTSIACSSIPVIEGVQVLIYSNLAGSVVSAYFYPCTGNV